MAIPEQVKKLAFDAVGHKETTAMIRLYINDNSWQPFNHPSVIESIPKREGLARYELIARSRDAVSHSVTLSQIRLISVKHVERPLPTPTRRSRAMSQQIAEMHSAGHHIDIMQMVITKNGFGREK